MLPAPVRSFLADIRARGELIFYSFGMGEDISFDIGLTCVLNTTVHLFDPSPHAAKHFSDVMGQLGQQGLTSKPHVGVLPSCGGCTSTHLKRRYWNAVRASTVPNHAFQHSRVALSEQDGMQSFFQAKSQAAAGSFSLDADMRGGKGNVGRTIQVRTSTLPTLMAQLGHHRIDVLKIDVEGLEVELLTLFLRSGVLPLVVFVDIDALCCCLGTAAACKLLRHKATRVIAKLTSAGYSQARTPASADYTFFRLPSSRGAAHG